jgi:hypothetical protein
MTWVPLGLALLVCGVTWWRLAVVTRRLDHAHTCVGHLLTAHEVNIQLVDTLNERLAVVERRRCAGAQPIDRN